LFAFGTQLPQRSAARVQRSVVSKAIKAVDANGNPETPTEDWDKTPCLAIGSTAPFVRFDPAVLLSGLPSNEAVRYRESELTHGRVAMLASAGMLVGEHFNPLFGGSITGPAINQFQQVPDNFWIPLTAVIALCELYRARTGWNNPFSGEDMWTCRADYLPGDLGYDPLGLKPNTPGALLEMQNKELNNGRLAMIGVAGMIAQELVTQDTIPLPFFK